MDVRDIAQGRVAVHTAPRPGNGPPAGRGAPAPHGSTRSTDAGAGAPAAGSAVLFDANGDGVIESWSIAHGGDSFSNFDPPPSGSFGSDTTSARHPADAAHHGTASSTDAALRDPPRADRNAHGTSPAALHHARAAYERDGEVNAAGNGTPPPAAAPAPAKPVAQLAATPALPSPAS